MVRVANTQKMTLTRTLHSLAFSLLIASVASAQGNDNCALAVAQSLSVGNSITLSGNNSTATAAGDFVAGSL